MSNKSESARILLVEDVPESIEVAGSILKEKG